MSPTDYPSLWNLPANPVFRRHAVAALRPMRLASWVLVTQVLAAFVWGATVLFCVQLRSEMLGLMEPGTPEFREALAKHGEVAFLLGWLAILALQGVVVVVKGTFSVATGVACEANEGMIEAERLSPLPTGHKVAGQLLGLPLREIVVGLLLLPWALLSASLGDLPLAMIAKVYLIFATSAIFHHAVGLVAGTLIRQKILAGTLSQALILLLHFVLPALGGFGIGLISHLGAEAAILDQIVRTLPHLAGPDGLVSREALRDSVGFFRWEVSVSGYHWVITLSALVVLLAMLARRWENPHSQWLGKVGTLALGLWLLVLTCGELLPPFWRGEGLSNSAWAFDLRFEGGYLFAGNTKLGVSIWMAGFAIALGLSNLILTGTLVPSADARRRPPAREPRPWWDDGRNALPWVALLSLLSAAAWTWVVGALLRGTPNLGRMTVSPSDALWVAASMLAPALACHGVALWKGWKVAFPGLFLFWLVPPMVAAIGLLASASPEGWPLWLAGLSGPVLPGYAALGKVAEEEMIACSGALHVSLLVHLVIAAFCLDKASGRGK